MDTIILGARDEEEFLLEYERDNYNKDVLKTLEQTAELAKQNGVFDPEKYNAARAYYDQEVKKNDFVAFCDSPIYEFVDEVREKIKEKSKGSKM